jgi:hypothetical protein
LCFRAVFVSYCHYFGFPRWFTRPMRLTTCLRGMSQNLSFLYLWPFFELLSIVLGFGGDLHGQWHLVHVWEAWPKLIVFVFLAVSWAIGHSLGFSGWFTRPMTLSTCLGGMTENSSFLHLWTFLWAIAHYFGVLGWFRRNMTICTCLRGMTKNSSFLCFWAIFVSYCP